MSLTRHEFKDIKKPRLANVTMHWKGTSTNLHDAPKEVLSCCLYLIMVKLLLHPFETTSEGRRRHNTWEHTYSANRKELVLLAWLRGKSTLQMQSDQPNLLQPKH